jgi:hypothetical protein
MPGLDIALYSRIVALSLSLAVLCPMWLNVLSWTEKCIEMEVAAPSPLARDILEDTSIAHAGEHFASMICTFTYETERDSVMRAKKTSLRPRGHAFVHNYGLYTMPH